WARYGLTLEKTARTTQSRAQALAVLEKVLTRDPGRTEVRRKAARLAVDLRRFPEARQHLEILQNSFPHDGELEQLLATSLEAQGDLTRAADLYQKAIDDSRKTGAAKERVLSYVRLAYLRRVRFDDAKR